MKRLICVMAVSPELDSPLRVWNQYPGLLLKSSQPPR